MLSEISTNGQLFHFNRTRRKKTLHTYLSNLIFSFSHFQQTPNYRLRQKNSEEVKKSLERALTFWRRVKVCTHKQQVLSLSVERFCYFQQTQTSNLVVIPCLSSDDTKDFHYRHLSTRACPRSPLMSSSRSVSQSNSTAVSGQRGKKKKRKEIAGVRSINGPFSSRREQPSHLRRLFQAR